MPGTTPVYGFPYPEPTDLVADYPALGQQLAEDIEDVLPTVAGLAPATPTSIANSGGSASLSGNTVTFSGVSSVSLNGCFTGDYDNYRVIARYNGTTAADGYMRVRAAGTDLSTSTYQWNTGRVSLSTIAGTSSGADTALGFFTVRNSTNSQHTVLDVLDPYVAKTTTVMGLRSDWEPSGAFHLGRVNNTTQYDGFTIYPASGTLTGQISVYGYKK